VTETYQRFVGIYCLHLQVARVSINGTMGTTGAPKKTDCPAAAPPKFQI